MFQTLPRGIQKSHKTSEPATAIDEFLANISHELRTPTWAILGWAELLDKVSIDKADLAKAVEVIKRNALVQVRLIDELADFSRLGANKLALNIRKVSLAQIVRSAVEALEPIADKKPLHMDLELGLSVAEIDGDPMRLQQVFLNLLSNAIKFTPSGGSVIVKLESAENYHTIIVHDTGEGINAEFLPFVFERYRQADETPGSYGGLGLGLAIARQIIELHGGTIRAESKGKGAGASFIVQFPRETSRQHVDLLPPAAI